MADRAPAAHWTTIGFVRGISSMRSAQVAERDVPRAVDVAAVPLVLIAHVDQRHGAARQRLAQVAGP